MKGFTESSYLRSAADTVVVTVARVATAEMAATAETAVIAGMNAIAVKIVRDH